MKLLNPMWVGSVLGAGVLATVVLLPQAKGELVYESGSNKVNAQVDDRVVMRQALGASEKAQVTLQVQAGDAATGSTSAPLPAMPAAVAATTTVTETENMTKAELMRRERQRVELKNEDILQERLEELRLRDERRRSQELLTAGAVGATGSLVAPPAVAPAPAVVVPLHDEIVVAPVMDRVSPPVMAPAMTPAVANTTVVVDRVGGTQAAPISSMAVPQMQMSVAPSGASEASSEKSGLGISVSPTAGMSNMVGQSGYFNIYPHFSGGIMASLGASDYFSFQVGYTYSQYGVAMASSNPWAVQQQQQAAALGQANFQTLNMNQNVFDAGVKVHLLGPDSRIRPFIGAGGAYAMSYINFTSSILSQMNATFRQNISPDYNVNNFLGYASGGMDFKISKNISVGAEFRYYLVLSATESNQLQNYYGVMYGGYNPYAYGAYGSGVNSLNQDTQVAGGTLANNNFYSVLGHVTFTF